MEVEFYQRVLIERHRDLVAKIIEFLEAISSDIGHSKAVSAQKLLTCVDDLSKLTSKQDRPGWIDAVAKAVRKYALGGHPNSGDAGKAVLEVLMDNYAAIKTQKWNATEHTKPGVDFNGIYERYYTASQIPELFDDLIGHLEKIIQSGEVDSVKTIKALEKIIATIRENALRDYFSTRATWATVKTFLKHLSIETLANIKVLKPIIEAIRKTRAEIDGQWAVVEQQIQEEVSNTEEFLRIEFQPLAIEHHPLMMTHSTLETPREKQPQVSPTAD